MLRNKCRMDVSHGISPSQLSDGRFCVRSNLTKCRFCVRSSVRQLSDTFVSDSSDLTQKCWIVAVCRSDTKVSDSCGAYI